MTESEMAVRGPAHRTLPAINCCVTILRSAHRHTFVLSKGCACCASVGTQVNAVKSQAVEGDKALIMADLIQVRMATAGVGRGQAITGGCWCQPRNAAAESAMRLIGRGSS